MIQYYKQYDDVYVRKWRKWNYQHRRTNRKTGSTARRDIVIIIILSDIFRCLCVFLQLPLRLIAVDGLTLFLFGEQPQLYPGTPVVPACFFPSTHYNNITDTEEHIPYVWYIETHGRYRCVYVTTLFFFFIHSSRFTTDDYTHTGARARL